MRVRLVLLGEGGELAEFRPRSLRKSGGECAIGREGDVEIDDPRISREHAAIARDGDRFWIVDLGSSNGTQVGGIGVGSDGHPLSDGDTIVLANAVALRFELEEDSDDDGLPVGRLAAIAVGVALVAALGFGLWRWVASGDPLLAEARSVTERASDASRGGRHEEAVDVFREAVGLLFREGRLDEVPRGELMRAGLAQIAEDEAEAQDLWALFERSLEARGEARDAQSARTRSERIARAEPRRDPERYEPDHRAADRNDFARLDPSESDDTSHSLDVAEDDFDDGWNARATGRFDEVDDGVCRLATAAAYELPDCLIAAIDELMIDLRQDTGSVPEDFHREVGRRILHEHKLLTNAFGRRELVEPIMRRALVEARLPVKLHYLALIESGYRRDAQSPAGALGLWQFMKGTGRQYGLRVDGRVDERRDPVKSSDAAARYLRDLTFEFGGDAILLALASYNRGQNAVRRALKKLDDPFSDRSYWRLVERGLLPRETALYVTRFAAAAVTGEHGLPRQEVLEEAYGR